jgi:hypothetical protein
VHYLACRHCLFFAEDGVEHAVDEGGTLLGGEFLGELDGFVDDDLGGRVGIGQLPDGEAEDVAIDAGLAARGPLRGETLDPYIDGFTFIPCTRCHRQGFLANLRILAAIARRLIGGGGIERIVRIKQEKQLQSEAANFGFP